MVSITRTQLYDRVWSVPMSQLAAEFGLSDVGLAKVCRRHDIPRPPRGYWAKKAAGQFPRVRPLPKADDDRVLKFNVPEVTMDDLKKDELQILADEVRADIRAVEVRNHLRGAHSLVADANQQLQLARADSEGFLAIPADLPLNVHVSKAQYRRALQIMDALLRALEGGSHKVLAGPKVELMGVELQLRISEGTEVVQAEPDEPELTDDNRYEFGHSRFRKLTKPSGKLSLAIDNAKGYWLSRTRAVWRDTPRRPLEQNLEKILAGLFDFAVSVRRHEESLRVEEERRKAAELRRAEEARVRAAKLKAIAEEQKRVDDLLRDAEDWKRSQILREYVQAVRDLCVTQHEAIAPDSEMAHWLDWAEAQAARLDPLVEGPPSILDETVEPELEPYGRYYGSR